MKKIISIITVAVLLMAMTVTAFAFPDPTANKNAWLEADDFNAATYKVSKATGTINIDGAVAAESAYGSSAAINIMGFSDYDNLAVTDGASGKAKVAWDADYIYIHLNVSDSTKGIGSGFAADSVEVYLDYDQKADGKKVKWNKVASSDVNAAQYRIQRGGSTIDNAVGCNDVMSSVGERGAVKVVENGTAGYIVEMKFPLKDKSGKYIPVSSTIGFELQVNDSKDGMSRDSAAYIQGGVQYYAYEYSHLFDNIKLDNCDITWSTRTVKTDVNETLRDFDPNSKYVPKPTSTASKVSSTASKTPSTASKVSSTASAVSSTASTAPTSNVESTVSKADTPVDENTPGDTNKNETDTETNDDVVETIGPSDDEGGMSPVVLIAIIAGGVLVVAAAVVAVIFIKKKKAK